MKLRRHRARTPLGRAKHELKVVRDLLHRQREWVEGYRQAVFDMHKGRDR